MSQIAQRGPFAGQGDQVRMATLQNKSLGIPHLDDIIGGDWGGQVPAFHDQGSPVDCMEEDAVVGAPLSAFNGSPRGDGTSFGKAEDLEDLGVIAGLGCTCEL